MALKRYASADKKRCVSCGACIKECRKEAISIWKGCYAVMNPEICIGCGLCQKVCPADCITFISREA